MAQGTVGTFKGHGAISVKEGDTITLDNFYDETNILRMARGVRIKDEFGNETPIRGARVTITTTGLTGNTSPLDNVPAIWQEGITTYFDDTMTFKFHDPCIINFGEEKII